ncbi:hypothetical protein YC2023_024076 [Brassica napus]
MEVMLVVTEVELVKVVAQRKGDIKILIKRNPVLKYGTAKSSESFEIMLCLLDDIHGSRLVFHHITWFSTSTHLKKFSRRLQRSLPDDFQEVFQTTLKKSSRRLPRSLLIGSSSISIGTTSTEVVWKTSRKSSI